MRYFPKVALPLLLSLATLSANGQFVFSTKADRPLTARNSEGTVNVFLANRNGIVAVTDSRLSSNGRPVGQDTKLFRIDDHTICAIAGNFSVGGPSPDGSNYPAHQTVAWVIQQLINHLSSGADLTLERKIDLVANIVGFTLEMMSQISERSGILIAFEDSVITMASFNGRNIEIAQERLTPTRDANGFVFTYSSDPILEVSDRVVFKLAGISVVGDDLLVCPDTGLRDQVIKRYCIARAKDHGSSLSLADMEEIASDVERITAASYPNIVGGPIQIGTIENGFARIITQDVEPWPNSGPEVRLRMWIDHVSIGGGDVSVPPGFAAFVSDSTIRNARFVLDNKFVFNSRFENCTLVYKGSPMTIFDRSNTFSNGTELQIQPGVDPHSALVRRIQEDFPSLRITPP